MSVSCSWFVTVLFLSAVAGLEDEAATDTTREVVVCRASSDGMWVSGELRPEQKSCIVAFLGARKSYERYQVLENVDGGSRLAWVPWNKFNLVPTGAVACGEGVETFIARRKDESLTGDRFSHHIGQLDPKVGLGKISIVNKVNHRLAP